MDGESVARAVDELGRILRADGADLLLVEANPKTARVHLRLVLDTVGCEECILPPADAARDDQRLVAAPDRRRVRARARRPAHDQRDARLVDDRDSSTRGARSSPCTSRCCTTSCARSRTTPGSTRACSPRSRTSPGAEPRGPDAAERAPRAHAPALQPARPEPARAAHGGRRTGRAARRSRRRPRHGPRDHAGRAHPLRPRPTRCTRPRCASTSDGTSRPRRPERWSARSRPVAEDARLRACASRTVRTRMIKYIGSKRRLVPVLGDLAAAVGARTALDLFTGTTRVAQEFKRRGHARDRGRLGALRRGVRAAATWSSTRRRVDARRARRRARRPRGAARRRRLRHRDVLRAVPVLPAVQRPAHRRDPRRDRSRLRATSPLVSGPAHEPDRGRRPGRLHHRRADGVREAVGAALVPPARAPRARAARRPGRGGARRRVRAGRRARAVRLRVPRPAVQPAPLLHELPHLGDAGRVGRAGALRRRVQARRRPRPRDAAARSTSGAAWPTRSPA